MFAGGSSATIGLPGRDQFALPIKCVVNQRGGRRDLRHLREIPCRLRELLAILVASSARGIEVLRRGRAGAEKLFLPLE